MAWVHTNWDEQHRETLLRAQSTLDRTSGSIARSTQIAVETGEIGTAVITELGHQRESLIRARNRVHETDAELGRSRALIRKMVRGVLTNKLILILIIILELCILAGVVYLKFFSKK